MPVPTVDRTSRPPTIRGMALFGRQTVEDQQRAEAWRDWLRSRNPLAIASLVLGIFSLIEFGALVIFGIAGIVLGVMALGQLRRAGEDGGAVVEREEDSAPPVAQVHGHRLAWAGILLSALSLIIAAVLYLLPHLKR
jgi:hypothetical protein